MRGARNEKDYEIVIRFRCSKEYKQTLERIIAEDGYSSFSDFYRLILEYYDDERPNIREHHFYREMFLKRKEMREKSDRIDYQAMSIELEKIAQDQAAEITILNDRIDKLKSEIETMKRTAAEALKV